MTTKRRYGHGGPYKIDLSRSLEVGAKLLIKAKVPFALCGSLAAWQYLPPDAHPWTRDVDFAVPHGRDLYAAEEARRAGYKVEEIDIGGYTIRGRDVLVDFVSRRVYHASLFAEAVSMAGPRGAVACIGRRCIPVVPVEYLIAMKMLTFRVKDDEVAMALLRLLSPDQIEVLRAIIVRHLPALYEKMAQMVARVRGERPS